MYTKGQAGGRWKGEGQVLGIPDLMCSVEMEEVRHDEK